MPSFGFHCMGGTWEESAVIEGDVPLIRTKKRV